MKQEEQICIIKQYVEEILGADRVREVTSRVSVNSDGMSVLRLAIVYDAEKGIEVEEIERVIDAAWLALSDDLSASPVIDFREDTDVGFLAAE